jgi:hypothetical protein
MAHINAFFYFFEPTHSLRYDTSERAYVADQEEAPIR